MDPSNVNFKLGFTDQSILITPQDTLQHAREISAQTPSIVARNPQPKLS